jgi:hypothetical protein
MIAHLPRGMHSLQKNMVLFPISVLTTPIRAHLSTEHIYLLVHGHDSRKVLTYQNSAQEWTAAATTDTIGSDNRITYGRRLTNVFYKYIHP